MKKRKEKSTPKLLIESFEVDFELKTTWGIEDKLKFVTSLLNSDQRKELSESERYMEMQCALIDACKRIRELELKRPVIVPPSSRKNLEGSK